MLHINTKYRIDERELVAILKKIEESGYEEAFKIALEASLAIAASNPESLLSTTYLAWSHNLMNDARGSLDANEAAALFEVANFYRRLAHKVYWFQLEKDLIAPIKDFIQVVK